MSALIPKLGPLQFGVDPVTAPAERGIAMSEDFQEYPKWVYPNGDATKGVKVHDAEQEAQALGEPQPEKRKPGRPRKGE
jgi:hypothetical protein